MENATEALKMAGAMLLFLMALTISIASFSKINVVVSDITRIKDREQDYYYISNAKELDNVVGAEIIVPTMYRAYFESIEVHFKDKSGNPIPIYNQVDNKGNPVKIITSIDLSSEKYSDKKEAIKHLDYILSGDSDVWGTEWDKVKIRFEKELIYKKDFGGGFFEKILKNKVFEQTFEEKYIGEGTSKMKKIIITYKQK